MSVGGETDGDWSFDALLAEGRLRACSGGLVSTKTNRSELPTRQTYLKGKARSSIVQAHLSFHLQIVFGTKYLILPYSKDAWFVHREPFSFRKRQCQTLEGVTWGSSDSASGSIGRFCTFRDHKASFGAELTQKSPAPIAHRVVQKSHL